MSPMGTDKELGEHTAMIYAQARKIAELVRDGHGFELMKTLALIEIAVQLAQQRLTEL